MAEAGPCSSCKGGAWGAGAGQPGSPWVLGPGWGPALRKLPGATGFLLGSPGLSVGNQFSHWPRPQREWSRAVPVLGAGCRLPTPARLHAPERCPHGQPGASVECLLDGWVSEDMKEGRNEWQGWMAIWERAAGERGQECRPCSQMAWVRRWPCGSSHNALDKSLNLSVPQTSHQMAELMVAPAPYRSAQRVKGVNGHTRGGRDVINRGQERRRVGGGVMSLFSY